MTKKENTKSNPVQEQKITHPEAIGLWMVPDEKAKFEGNGWMAIPWQRIFKYDGTYVTLAIFSVVNGTPINPVKWISKDSYYKVKTIWRQDSLYYVSPFTENEFLGFYHENKFYKTETTEGLSYTWEYERITEKEVPEHLKPVLKKRKPFDYSIIK